MKVCPHCHKDLPNDSIYCTYCGQSIEEIEKKEETTSLKKNPRKNNWAILGLLLLCIGLFGFDFVLAMIFDAFHASTKIPFYISLVLYICSMVCGILSLYVDKKDTKAGYESSGNNKYAYVCICISLFIALMNLTQVIL